MNAPLHCGWTMQSASPCHCVGARSTLVGPPYQVHVLLAQDRAVRFGLDQDGHATQPSALFPTHHIAEVPVDVFVPLLYLVYLDT